MNALEIRGEIEAFHALPLRGLHGPELVDLSYSFFSRQTGCVRETRGGAALTATTHGATLPRINNARGCIRLFHLTGQAWEVLTA